MIYSKPILCGLKWTLIRQEKRPKNVIFCWLFKLLEMDQNNIYVFSVTVCDGVMVCWRIQMQYKQPAGTKSTAGAENTVNSNRRKVLNT